MQILLLPCPVSLFRVGVWLHKTSIVIDDIVLYHLWYRDHPAPPPQFSAEILPKLLLPIQRNRPTKLRNRANINNFRLFHYVCTTFPRTGFRLWSKVGGANITWIDFFVGNSCRMYGIAVHISRASAFGLRNGDLA